MKKIMIFLGALALVAAMSTATMAAEKELCQERKAEIVDVSPKKDIVYTLPDCAPTKPEAAQSQNKKGM